jgi:hypothetical protein
MIVAKLMAGKKAGAVGAAEDRRNCGYGRLMSRRMNSRITAPMKATMIEPIMPPPVEIPANHRANDADDDIDDQAKSTTFYDLSRQPAGDCSDHKPSDDPVFHPISPLFFMDELAALSELQSGISQRRWCGRTPVPARCR